LVICAFDGFLTLLNSPCENNLSDRAELLYLSRAILIKASPDKFACTVEVLMPSFEKNPYNIIYYGT
jgi:hypothetical protein